jgi:para-nitrobenzyl esterase
MLTGPVPTAEIEAASSAVRTAWTRFAATGDPGWPAYDPEQRQVLLIDAQPHTGTYPEEASRALWQDHTFGALPLHISG